MFITDKFTDILEITFLQGNLNSIRRVRRLISIFRRSFANFLEYFTTYIFFAIYFQSSQNPLHFHIRFRCVFTIKFHSFSESFLMKTLQLFFLPCCGHQGVVNSNFFFVHISQTLDQFLESYLSLSQRIGRLASGSKKQ